MEKALKELREKELLDIEMETAKTWGGRAAASYRLAMETGKLGERIRHIYEGENFRQEALEHASMTEDLDFLQEIGEEIQEARKEALEVLQGLLTKTTEDVGVEESKAERPQQFGRRHEKGRARRERLGVPMRGRREPTGKARP